MKFVRVLRDSYEILFGLEDGDPEYVVTYNGFGDAKVRAGDIITADELELTINADMTAGEYTDSGIKTPISADSLGEMSATQTDGSLPIDGEPGLFMQHLKVNEDYRRRGAGSFMFDAYRGAAVWLGGHASGKIGSYEKTRRFLIRQGVPDSDIEQVNASWGPGNAAAWSTPVENLHEDDRNVTVEEM